MDGRPASEGLGINELTARRRQSAKGLTAQPQRTDETYDI
jgi:hypothetical protein